MPEIITSNLVVVFLAVAAVLNVLWRLIKWGIKADTSLENFSKFIEETKGDLGKIKSDIGRLLSEAEETVKGSSPVSLTEKGDEISKQLDAKSWAADRAPHLYNQVFGKMEHEIYAFCKGYVREYKFTAEQDNKIDEVAYQNAVSRGSTLDVLIVELRDHLLDMHGIKKS